MEYRLVVKMAVTWASSSPCSGSSIVGGACRAVAEVISHGCCLPCAGGPESAGPLLSEAQCIEKCPFTCIFDRCSAQCRRSLDRPSDQFAAHRAGASGDAAPLFPIGLPAASAGLAPAAMHGGPYTNSGERERRAWIHATVWRAVTAQLRRRPSHRIRPRTRPA